ncbi:MAG: DUF92 domain-containing protein [Gemmatimonadales bacterium]
MVSASVACIAWFAATLTLSGALAAWVVGAGILHGTGWTGGAVLAAFFISSNLISRVAPAPLTATIDVKGDRRDAWQVLANGAAAGLLALFGSSDPALRIWLVTATLSAAAADTWASSVGARSRAVPRLLWSRDPVPSGTNGGITAAGNAGALAGATIVSATAALLTGNARLLPAGILIGFFGMLMDSLLGDAIQATFWCPRCRQPSEWRVHRCGTSTDWKSGWVWLNNDRVNLLATAMSGGLAWTLWRWLD